MQNSSSLSLLPGPLWPEVVAPDRVLSMGQIELFNIYIDWFGFFVLMAYQPLKVI